jgi:hypothetical protein
MNEASNSIGKRLGRFIALIVGVATLVTAIVVTQRLSQDSLALLVGLSCGVMAMAPTVGLALLIWRREMRQQRQSSQPGMAAPTPPVVVVTPQALPGYGPQANAYRPSKDEDWQWQSNGRQRTFTIVGGEQ